MYHMYLPSPHSMLPILGHQLRSRAVSRLRPCSLPADRVYLRRSLNLNTSATAGARSDFFIQNGQEPISDQRVFFFDIDNCLYPKSSGIPALMKDRIENYFKESGIPHSEVANLANKYYLTYGLAIRGLVERHPEIDIKDYDDKVDGALPLETILKEDPALRDMIQSMTIGKKWLFTNAGESHARRVIRILGLQGLFHGMTFCNYQEPRFVCKPDRKAFEKAMEDAGVQDPSLCYFVDDSLANIDAAKQVGWTTVHVVEEESEISRSGNFRVCSVHDLARVMPQLWERREQ